MSLYQVVPQYNSRYICFLAFVRCFFVAQGNINPKPARACAIAKYYSVVKNKVLLQSCGRIV